MKFGTDGIRGRYGTVITEAVAFAVGSAAVRTLGPWVAVARDTRPSGPALEEAVVQGIVAAGGFAVRFGVMPTPALSRVLAGHASYHAGILITASHNPAPDNGLKVVDGAGHKLGAAVQAAFEAALPSHVAREGGNQRTDPTAASLYVNAMTTRYHRALEGRRVVLDAGNGAGHEIAARVLEGVGAKVEVVDQGLGARINDGCGALHPGFVRPRVGGADAGIALDGDGDRVALVTPEGAVLDGDALLWLLARPPRVVGTVMTNLGLERALAGRGITLERTPVGDAEVAARMKQTGALVGGEPSGHLLFADGGPTADGVEVAIRALAGGPLAPRLAGYTPSFQAHAQVARTERTAVDRPEIRAAVSALEAEGARVVVRPSGTEPVIRIMVEHLSPDVARAGLDRLRALLEAAP